MPDKEGRRHARKAVKSAVECSDTDGNMVFGTGTVRDISTGGCRIETSLKLADNQELRLALYGADGKESLELAATVLWRKDAGTRKTYGLRFGLLSVQQRAALEELLGA